MENLGDAQAFFFDYAWRVRRTLDGGHGDGREAGSAPGFELQCAQTTLGESVDGGLGVALADRSERALSLVPRLEFVLAVARLEQRIGAFWFDGKRASSV